MASIEMIVETGRLTARLEKIAPDVKEALKSALKPLTDELAADARGLAQAHIRYLGAKPGQYLASIYGNTFDKGDRVGGFVRSGNPLAHLLEHGASIPPHTILPKVADVLAFEGDAGTVFARFVRSPGATVPPYPAIEPAFASAEGRIRETLTKAVQAAL